MPIRVYNAYTPGTRNKVVSDFSEINKSQPEKALTKTIHREKGRNNQTKISMDSNTHSETFILYQYVSIGGSCWNYNGCIWSQNS